MKGCQKGEFVYIEGDIRGKDPDIGYYAGVLKESIFFVDGGVMIGDSLRMDNESAHMTVNQLMYRPVGNTFGFADTPFVIRKVEHKHIEYDLYEARGFLRAMGFQVWVNGFLAFDGCNAYHPLELRVSKEATEEQIKDIFLNTYRLKYMGAPITDVQEYLHNQGALI